MSNTKSSDPGLLAWQHTHAPVHEDGRLIMTQARAHVRRGLSNISSNELAVADALVAFASVWLGYWISPFGAEALYESGHMGPWRYLLLQIPAVVLLMRIFGLQDPLMPRDGQAVAIKLVCVVVLADLLVTGIGVALFYDRVGRLIQLGIGCSTWLGLFFMRRLYWQVSEENRHMACFVGSRGFLESSRQVVIEHPKPVRQVFLEAGEGSQVVASTPEGNVRLVREGGRGLLEWAREGDFDEVVVSGHLDAELDQQLMECLDAGVTVISWKQFVERHYRFVPVGDLDSSWFLESRLEALHPYYRVLKRGTDIALGVAGLVSSAPLLGLAVLAIRLESPGAVFYSQIRVGANQRPFRIYKLRSMRTDAERGGAQWATEGDARVTRVGRILRKTRIDEIPQFWNILRGDMSFIGPRPERPEFTQELARQIPFYNKRHLVKPGLTGWAQINYPYGASVEDARAKLTYDLYYVKHASLELDLDILVRTIGAVMKGAR